MEGGLTSDFAPQNDTADGVGYSVRPFNSLGPLFDLNPLMVQAVPDAIFAAKRLTIPEEKRIGFRCFGQV